MSKDNLQFERMGKRRFLKTLAAFGVPSASLPYLTTDVVEAQTSDPKKEIPYIAAYDNSNGNPKPVWDTVRQERRLKTQALEGACSRLRHELSKKYNLDKVSFRAKMTETGKPEIEVAYRIQEIQGKNNVQVESPEVKKETLEATLPAKVDQKVDFGEVSGTVTDIPVFLEEQRVVEEAYYDCEYTPVPAGCKFDHGTLCSRGWKESLDTWVIVASGHGLKHAYNNDDDLNQPDDGRKIGNHEDIAYSRVDTEYDVTDFGYFFPNMNGTDVTDDFATDACDSPYANEPIAGNVSFDWVKNNLNEDTVYKQGAETGFQSGVLTSYENDRDNNEKVYWTDLESTSGDSGAPVFTEIDGDRYLVGLHAWAYETDSGDNRAGGNTCEKINDEMGIVFY